MKKWVYLKKIYSTESSLERSLEISSEADDEEMRGDEDDEDVKVFTNDYFKMNE